MSGRSVRSGDLRPSLDDAIPEGLRVAVVHDWLTGMRGGEKCLEVVLELFPRADLYTLFHFKGSVSKTIERHRIFTSRLQHLPGLERWYRYGLPSFPRAIGSFDLSRYDLIVSLSHCVAKGAGAGSGVPHLCYCFTPMRYLWDQSGAYFNRDRFSGPALWMIERLLKRLRAWDRTTHPDRYIAISQYIADRIQRHYERSSEIVYPPVDLERFHLDDRREDYYLVVSALVPYKRIELAVEAANQLGRRLIVIGKGEEESRLRELAGPSVEILGWRPDEEVARLMSGCRGFLLPGEEDFGITPLEAAASGRPVVALARGGATETVVDARARRKTEEPTGVLFPEPTVDSLVKALRELESRETEFRPTALRAHAARFSLSRFRRELRASIASFVNASANAPS